MDRREPRGINNSRSMQAFRGSAFQLLLQERAHQGIGIAVDASCGRDLYSTAFFRFAQDCSGFEKRGLQCQSQTRPTDHATLRIEQQPTWTQYLKIASGTHQVPLPVERRSSISTVRGLEYRYYVHSAAERICVPRRSDRLVQSLGIVLSAVQQLGDKLLPRRLRRGHRTLRTAPNLQYRPGGAIYLKRVRSSGSLPEYSLQHGRARTRIRQRICGTVVEIGQI